MTRLGVCQQGRWKRYDNVERYDAVNGTVIVYGIIALSLGSITQCGRCSQTRRLVRGTNAGRGTLYYPIKLCQYRGLLNPPLPHLLRNYCSPCNLIVEAHEPSPWQRSNNASLLRNWLTKGNITSLKMSSANMVCAVIIQTFVKYDAFSQKCQLG